MSIFKTIATKAGTTAKKTARFWQKHGSTIMHVTGIVADPAATVVACIETHKLPAVMKKHEDILRDLHENHKDDEDFKKKLMKAYFDTGRDLAKLYWKSAALEAISIGCRIGDHTLLKKQNAALTASYIALGEAYYQYRERVVKDLGKEKDVEYATGGKYVEKEVIDPETGEIKTAKTLDLSKDADLRVAATSHIYMFDERLTGVWQYNAQMNLSTIKRVQDYANDQLMAKGYLLLADVLQELGFDKLDMAPNALTDGWIVDYEKPYKISFGEINDILDDPTDIRNAVPMPIVLDFNCDADILNLVSRTSIYSEKRVRDEQIEAEFVKQKAIQDEIDEKDAWDNYIKEEENV